MYSYVAFIWNPLDADSAASASTLSNTFDRAKPDWAALREDGLLVYSANPTERALACHTLAEHCGVILGRLFPKTLKSSSGTLLTATETQECVRTRGKRLIENYWGNYIAFLRSPQKRMCFVLRDCSGRLPCYRMHHKGVEIIFSDVNDIRQLPLRPFTLNWEYITAFLYYPELQIRRCGIKEVTEVLAGESLEIEAGCVKQIVSWDPKTLCLSDRIEKHEDAVKRLRWTTEQCIRHWSSSSAHILLRLSGGLDSAIVLGCLRKARSADDLTCLNIYGDTSSDDERPYARAAAKYNGVRLIEQRSAEHAFDARQYARPTELKPAVTSLFVTLETQLTNVITRQVGAEVIWTGQGGDHLFWQPCDPVGAFDYATNHGMRFGLLRAVIDAAHLSFSPYYSVLRATLRAKNRPRLWGPAAGDVPSVHFLSDSRIFDGIDEYVIPRWMEGCEALPVGKQMQIYYLCEVLNRHRPFPGYEHSYEYHPLLSQPLVELCLQIPTYVLSHRGCERGLAREAFKDLVPEIILQRDDKGDMSFTVTDAIRRSEGFLSDVLLNGLLVNEGILSRTALERFLVHKESLRMDNCRPLLACIAAEIWARKWSAVEVQVEAA